MSTTIDSNNYVLWDTGRQARRYGKRSELFPAEQVIFDKYLQTPVERLLDLGVGAGRTTGYLINQARYYVGTDYAAPMIDAAQKAHPGVDFRVGDASDLSDFADSSTDFVLFSFNGIDSMGHEKRLKTLAEAHRVLKPGGLFSFSTHNRDFATPAASSLEIWRPTLHPLKMAKRTAVYLLGNYRYNRLKPSEIETDSYHIKVDSSEYFGRLQYYISLEKQQEQLRDAGFETIEALGGQGEKLALDRPYRGDFMVYLTARKA